MRVVDLNSDIGEGFGCYTMGDDKAIMAQVSSVNCACGWHAGDPLIMAQVAKQAKALGVSLGAHPSLPDLLGFGRRKMEISPKEARAYMLYQVGALNAFAKACGYTLGHVKLHGSFYNQAAHDVSLATAILEGIEDYDPNLVILCLSGSAMAKQAQRKGLRVAQEVFADRRYYPDARLVERAHPKALISDPEQAIEQVLGMVINGRVQAIDGTSVEIQADSICVHGDHKEALEFALQIRQALEHHDIAIKPLYAL
ncbi:MULTISPECIES: LamB/YcsF family protein [Helicobacter]|uniref:LamB/YcsF family protein n=1 Tax=Helicobacter TaxID=209 RepID=UPI000EB11E05|nr:MULTISPECIES: 5-oxoprolinase subunit PxpA [Helicobacter]